MFGTPAAAHKSRLAPGALWIAAILPACLRCVHSQVPQFGQQYSGDGTYYGIQTPYAQGHCSFQFANSYPLPWSTGISAPLALNAPQYTDSTGCGLCVQYRGVGTGSGANPIQTDEWKFGIVSDECPECLAGSLDLAVDGDGRWQIEWISVQCDVGTSSFVYSLQGSNAYYIKLMIANTRVPVASATLNGVPMSKTIDNYWLATASQAPGFVFPLPITLTSLLGDTVTDTVPGLSFPDGVGNGTTQFPVSCNYGSVQPGGVLPLSGQPQTSGVPQACPTSSSGNSSSTPPSSPPPASLPPQPQSPPPALALPLPPLSSPPPPVASPPPAPIQVTPAAPPPPSAVAQTSPPPAGLPLPAAKTVPALAPSFESFCNRTIPLESQCGGEGGQCEIQGKGLDPANCVDDQWAGVCCPEGAFCQRLQRFIWQCASLDALNTTYSVQGSPIPPLYQCGGLGTCPKNLCADRQWTNTTCQSGSVCTRYDRNYWQCRALPFSTPVPPLQAPLPNPSPIAG